MKTYCGNARPFLYTLFDAGDKAAAERIMEALAEKGHSLWFADGFSRAEEKRLSRASALLVILSPRIAESERLKKAVSMATKADMPIISVFLEDTQLSPGLSMQLGTTQGILRQNVDEESAFLEKLCASPVLGALAVTPKQKKAAKRATLSLAAGAVAVVALVAVLVLLNPLGKRSTGVPVEDYMEKLSTTASVQDITTLYVYGSTVCDTYSLSQLTHLPMQPASAVRMDNGELYQNSELTNAEDFTQFQNLTELCLTGTHITDFSPFAKLTKLKMLDLSCAERFQDADLTPLTLLPELETLNLAFTFIQDLTPLRDCPALKTLYLSYNAEWAAQQAELDNVEIIYLGGKASNFASLKAAAEDPSIYNIHVTDSISIPAGETITLRKNTYMVLDDFQVSFVNRGELNIEGSFQLHSGAAVNHGTIHIKNDGALDLPRAGQQGEADGGLTNQGDLIIDRDGIMMLTNTHLLRQNSGRLQNDGEIVMFESGTIAYNGGEIVNNGEIYLARGGYFLDNGREVTGTGEIIPVN